MGRIFKLLFVLLLLCVVGGFFQYQMQKNDLLRLRDEVQNARFPIENRLFSIAQDVVEIHRSMGDFKSLEEEIIKKISSAKEIILNEKDLFERIAAMESLYSNIGRFLDHLYRYPDLFKDKDFTHRVDRVYVALEELRISAKRYNEAVSKLSDAMSGTVSTWVASRLGITPPIKIEFPKITSNSSSK